MRDASRSSSVTNGQPERGPQSEGHSPGKGSWRIALFLAVNETSP